MNLLTMAQIDEIVFATCPSEGEPLDERDLIKQLVRDLGLLKEDIEDSLRRLRVHGRIVGTPSLDGEWMWMR